MSAPTGEIRAAGGLLWRQGANGDLEVLLVHRPRHDDWSLPKGKLDAGEHPLRAAVREVWEETAVSPAVAARLPTVRYQAWARDALVEKVVDYWTMTVVSEDEFVPGDEIDGRAWLAPREATRRLSYPHDRRVLAAFVDLAPPLRAPVVVIGELEPAVARACAPILACYNPTRLVCGSSVPCRETLAPLAALLGLTVEVDPGFDRESGWDEATKRLDALSYQGVPAGAGAGAATVVCAEADMAAEALAGLTGGTTTSYVAREPTAWVLTANDRRLAAVDELALA